MIDLVVNLSLGEELHKAFGGIFHVSEPNHEYGGLDMGDRLGRFYCQNVELLKGRFAFRDHFELSLT